MTTVRQYESIFKLYLKYKSTGKNSYQRIADNKKISVSHVKNIIRVMRFNKTKDLLINKGLDLSRCLILLSIKTHSNFDEFALIAQSKISRNQLTQLIKNKQQPNFYILDNGERYTKSELSQLCEQLSSQLQTPVNIVIGQSSATLTVIIDYILLSWVLEFVKRHAIAEQPCKVQILNSHVSNELYDQEYRRDGQVHLVFTSIEDLNTFFSQIQTTNPN